MRGTTCKGSAAINEARCFGDDRQSKRGDPICFLKRYDVQDTIVKKESTYFFRVSFLIICLKNVAFDFLGAAE